MLSSVNHESVLHGAGQPCDHYAVVSCLHVSRSEGGRVGKGVREEQARTERREEEEVDEQRSSS